MIIPRCSICGAWFPLRPIQFIDGVVCRDCFRESGLPSADLKASYKTVPVYVVLDDGDRKRQRKERGIHEKERIKRQAEEWEIERKEKKAREIERRKREEEDRVREVAAKKQTIKEKRDRESPGFSKAVVFHSRWLMEDDAIIFFPNKGRIAIREMAATKEYELEKILEFEVLEGGFSIAKGGLGRAVVGGLLLGGTGAVVGAVTGGKKSKDVVTSLQLKLTLNDPETPVRLIDFISFESKRDGFHYKEGEKRLSEAVAMFKIMFKKNEKVRSENHRERPEEQQESSRTSCADELIKLKSLLDQGVITKTEFQKQKKRIMK